MGKFLNSEYHGRFELFLIKTGRSVESVKDENAIAHKYMVWNNEQWRKFRAEKDLIGALLTNELQEQYDEWLLSQKSLFETV